MKFKKLLYLIVISPLTVLIDQLTKILAEDSLTFGVRKTVIDGFFYLTLLYNRGAAWSILSGNRWFLVLVSIAATIGFIVYYLKRLNNSKAVLLLALSLVIGGTFGNLIDRALYGQVVDFLDFIIIGYNYPVFNFADTFLVIGMGLLVIAIYFEDKNESKTF
jgi:signal peptidase II